METFKVKSSNGELIVCAITGNVIACELVEGGDTDIQKIRRFDIAEWKEFWELDELLPEMDILDLGYWYARSTSVYNMYEVMGIKNKYEAPCFDWRELIINL